MSELLCLATAGSVDDGKSTLIGRLLFDSKAVFEDQLEAVRRTSLRRGEDQVNLALLTDGLRAEREQGITIDVAYRYFATAKRKFIIADTPGHVDYTRNMVTGASRAHLALVLVDARKGLTEQSRRHAFLASLLGIPHLVVCINKMDLVDWSAPRFEQIHDEFMDFCRRLEIKDVVFIPLSALHGDNVVERSPHMEWYQGMSLLAHLEDVYIGSDDNLLDPRFPVQYVIRPHSAEHHDYRGYAGTVASGMFRVGDEIVVLPAGYPSTIKGIDSPSGPVTEAFSPMAVALTLSDQIPVSRGDMICRLENRPTVTQDLEAVVCWMSESSSLEPGAGLLLKHTTRTVRATVDAVRYRLDVNTLHRQTDVHSLELNEIGRVSLRTTEPLCVDGYQMNRATGSFVLIDPVTNATVGAGMVRVVAGSRPPAAVVRVDGRLSEAERTAALGYRGATVLLTGLSGAGKSTLAVAAEEALVRRGRPAAVLDGDNLRLGLCEDLGFSPVDRTENLRRAGEVARLLAGAGTVALVALISPRRADRERLRAAHEAAGLAFVEVFVDTPLDECERRDPKGLYQRARAGQLADFTGVDAPYEVPLDPELVLTPADGSVADQVRILLATVDRVLGRP